MNHPQNNPWTKASYGSITGSGAAKLADSKVAPLVALARGYYRVSEKAETKALAEKATAGTSTIALTRKLNTLVANDEDLLVMPWYALSKVSDEGTAARSYNTQYRPSKPLRDENGKTAKYAWFAGERQVLDLHPSTPLEWLDSSLDVLLTEGVIKGDSALTSLLLDSGVSVEQLSATPAPAEARMLLNALMLSVPPSKRVPVINSGSVTTWEDQADQWRHIRMTDKRIIIAFDGDLAENRMVWKQTEKCMRFVRGRKGNPVILSMFSPEVEMAQIQAGMDPAEKLGIDDYLSHIGSWSELLTLTTDILPPEPAAVGIQANVGDWRVHPENDARVQEYAQETNVDGSKKPAAWVDRYRIGGRIVSSIAKRRPVSEEIISGVVDESQEMLLEDADCEIEVALLDPAQDWDQEPTLHRVVGPASLMSMPPSEWVKHARTLPNAVLNHPEWPPRKGQDWLSAVKANRRDEVEQVIAWNTMGWVPVAGGDPAFIVGSQVLGKTERDEDRTRTGVSEHTLPGASGFGLQDTYRILVTVGKGDVERNLEDYKAQVREDVRTVLTTYIENGFWKEDSTAVCVLAALLRPTIPLRPGITLYFVGPRRAGKSYSASFILSGWEGRAGHWNAQNLNGSANDTLASIEHAIAHSPIWVVDDFAPQVDKRKSEEQETALSQIIRSVANGSPRRRMDGKTMTQREAMPPIAMLVMTAENAPQVPSIQERIISVQVPSGSFDDSSDGWREKALKRSIREGAASRLNAAMVRLWHRSDTGLGATWRDRQAFLREMLEEQKENALEELHAQYGIQQGEASRHAGQVASLGLSFQVLYYLARWAGIEENDPILSRFGSGEGSYMSSLYEMAADSITKARGGAPGQALVEALARTLASGKAHLRNPTTPGAPPFVARATDNGGTEVGGNNEAAGWEYDSGRGTWVPRGTPIGYLGRDEQGKYLALIDTRTGFQEARRHYPTLIPHGQSSSASWESVWQEKLAATTTATGTGVTRRVSLSDSEEGKSSRCSGVPLTWEALSNSDLN